MGDDFQILGLAETQLQKTNSLHKGLISAMQHREKSLDKHSDYVPLGPSLENSMHQAFKYDFLDLCTIW